MKILKLVIVRWVKSNFQKKLNSFSLNNGTNFQQSFHVWIAVRIKDWKSFNLIYYSTYFDKHLWYLISSGKQKKFKYPNAKLLSFCNNREL